MIQPGGHVEVTATREPVVIWSSEHRAWWRAHRRGYCADPAGAGLYTLKEALAATLHVGPEKRIRIEDVPAIERGTNAAPIRDALRHTTSALDTIGSLRTILDAPTLDTIYADVLAAHRMLLLAGSGKMEVWESGI